MEIPYTVTARPDTGLWNAKVGIWLFLASEVMLFGGLFSSYLFLRLGADYPWPHGELQVFPFGFWNTIILIASSVFVVYSWVALKMRKYRQYQIWMTLVVVSAFGFLINKSFEYKAKFEHYHVKLKDGSVVSGHIANQEDRSFIFEASHVEVDYASGNHLFLKYLEGKEDITFTGNGKPVNPTSGWFQRLKAAQILAAKAGRLSEAGKAAEANAIAERVAKKYPEFADFKGSTTVRLALSKPGKFVIPRKAVAYNGWLPNKITLSPKYATTLEGKLTSSVLKVEIDELDLRQYLRPDGVATTNAVADSAIFKYLSEDKKKELLEGYNHIRDPKLKELNEKLNQWREKHPGKEPNEARFHDFERVYLKQLHAGDSHAADAHAAHPVATIPWDDVKFFSNFGPAKNTYYAIYFTMTGLHGLHVFGGALVLGYFLLFGKALYRKNPEHLANRVEVGGLFWHFVDLVWIFLFPIFYLM